MKKIAVLLAAGVLLAACSDTDKPESPTEDKNVTPPVEESESNEAESAEDQVSLEEGLKADSTEVNYEDIATGDIPSNTNVNFIGTIFEIKDDNYGLRNDVLDDAEETLWVKDIRLGEKTEIPEGTEVSVYGIYSELDDQDIPIIKAVFIDAQ